jgi:hypothetical protein
LIEVLKNRGTKRAALAGITKALYSEQSALKAVPALKCILEGSILAGECTLDDKGVPLVDLVLLP